MLVQLTRIMYDYLNTIKIRRGVIHHRVNKLYVSIWSRDDVIRFKYKGRRQTREFTYENGKLECVEKLYKDGRHSYTDYYSSGAKRSHYSDRSGIHRGWHENGQLSHMSTSIKVEKVTVPHGFSRNWNVGGLLTEESLYIKGNLIHRSVWENGIQVLFHAPHFETIKWDKNGTLITENLGLPN